MSLVANAESSHDARRLCPAPRDVTVEFSYQPDAESQVAALTVLLEGHFNAPTDTQSEGEQAEAGVPPWAA